MRAEGGVRPRAGPRRALRGLGLLLPLAVLAACGDDSTGPEEFDIREVEFADELGVDLDQMEEVGDQLFIQDLEEGDGELEAAPGDELSVEFTGWLPDGTEFDTSRDAADSFVFELGSSRLIEGWNLGIEGMRVGGLRLIVIPPDLAFGEQGTGPIPPNSAVVFEVELVDLERPAASGDAVGSASASPVR